MNISDLRLLNTASSKRGLECVCFGFCLTITAVDFFEISDEVWFYLCKY